MSRSRKDVLLEALKAEVGAEPFNQGSSSPKMSWLVALHDRVGAAGACRARRARELAFSNVVIMFRGLDEVGNKAFAEWVVEADHTGPTPSATARRLKLREACPAGRRHRRRLPRRQDPVVPEYFDDLSLLERFHGRLTTQPAVNFRFEDDRDPLDVDGLGQQIHREAYCSHGAAGRGRAGDLRAGRRQDRRPASPAGPGATAADCRISGSIRVSAVIGSGRGSSPPPRPRRRRARYCAGPIHFTHRFQAGRLYERAGSNWWTRSRTSLPERTSSGPSESPRRAAGPDRA